MSQDVVFRTNWNYLQRDTGNSSKSWENSLNKIGTVNNLNEFLHTLDQITADNIFELDNLYFFREDILPVAESQANAEGGRLMIELSKSTSLLVDIVRRTLVFCILEKHEEILGYTFDEKPNCYRLALWLVGPSKAKDISNDWESIFENGIESVIHYYPHRKYEDNFSKFSARKNNK